MWFLLLLTFNFFGSLDAHLSLEESALWRSMSDHTLPAEHQKVDFLVATQLIDSLINNSESQEIFVPLCDAWQSCLRGSLRSKESIEQLCLSLAELRQQVGVLKNHEFLSSYNQIQLRSIEEWVRLLVTTFCGFGSDVAQPLVSLRDRNHAARNGALVLGGAATACIVSIVLLVASYRSGYRKKKRHSLMIMDDSFSRETSAALEYPKTLSLSDVVSVPDEEVQSFTLLPTEVIARLQEDEGLVVHTTSANRMVIEIPEPALRGSLIREASYAHLHPSDAYLIRQAHEVAQKKAVASSVEEQKVIALLENDANVASLVVHIVGGRGPDCMAKYVRKVAKNKENGVGILFLEELSAECARVIGSFIADSPQEHLPVQGFLGKRSVDQNILSVAEFFVSDKDPLNTIFYLFRDNVVRQRRCAQIIIQSCAEMIMQQRHISLDEAHRSLVGLLWQSTKRAKILTKMHHKRSLALNSTNDDAGGAHFTFPLLDTRRGNGQGLVAEPVKKLIDDDDNT